MALKENIKITNSRSALTANLKNIKKRLPSDCLLSVAVKANAYGHGLIETSQELLKLGVNWLDVTSAPEGELLRQAKITAPILIIGPITDSDNESIIKYNLKAFVSNFDQAKKLNATAVRQKKTATIHLKINTGMNRQGFEPSEIKTIITTIKRLKHLKIEGIATHFATADGELNNADFAKQLSLFKQVAEEAEKIIGHRLIKHCANSSATLAYPDSHLDLVRIGLAVYGYYPSPIIKKLWQRNNQSLQPVMSVYTKVVQLKKIPANTGVSYGLDFHSRQPLTIALLPIGYADGLSRHLSNCGKVLIKGHEAPIIGKICMNITIVDVSKIKNIKLGDLAVIIGKSATKIISADELAKLSGTINYEVLTNFKESINRTYER